ncbi:MAG TPA: efflux RND transporter periplasmic adaptor subunit [Candidatus Paceibacterota bacterium]|nr:efflux RND transporter periplasmic adaptor subunit [Candidatus Paceibacterota bacterium]
MDRRSLAIAAFIVVVIGGGIAALAYLGVANKTVYIDKASISAPETSLAPTTGGVLQHTYVSVGDIIAPNTVVAQVGVELIKSTNGGLVIDARTDLGTSISPGTAVVTTIDPSALRAVGEVQEDKGLTDIKVGDTATFTVDAFGGQKFTGIVDEVSPTSNAGDVVFSVSNNREEQNFDVKVRFDTTQYPQLRNGMSAKIWVYKS